MSTGEKTRGKRAAGPGLRACATLLRAVVALCVGACNGDGGDAGHQATATATSTATPTPTPTPMSRLAVLSAFPAEMAPLLAQMTVDETVVVNGRNFRIGTLAGTPVILGMTGIGLVNAANTTAAVLDQFSPSGVIVSAVAGSNLNIGDIVVPETWSLADGSTFAVNASWFALAQEIAAANTVVLDDCTILPMSPSGPPVCLPNQPVMVVGGSGQSSDNFNNTAFPCQPNGGDVFGCDVEPSEPAATPSPSGSGAVPSGMQTQRDDTVVPMVTDMETAAIAREATQRGVSFIAFRAMSDGAGDPLGLPGFPDQFFAYYRLAANNAAAGTVAFLQRLRGE